jgi:hypothetical protein
MKRPLFRTVASRAATAVGAVVITTVVVAGGLSVAQASTEAVANNSVNSAKILNGSVQGIDIKNGTVAPGDLSPAARPRWAKVGGGTTGNLIRGRGATGSSYLSTGNYVVTFADPVANCGWTASLNDDGSGGAAPGQITVEQNGPSDAFTLRVRTYSVVGVQADTLAGDGFTVVVSC